MTIIKPVSLNNVTVSTIKPYTKTDHPAILKPALFDLLVLDVYIPIVFFYKPEKGLSADSLSLVDHLKESLSKVLVPYFPYAGRWVRTYDARIRELECNDEGVPFIEAFIDKELESVVNLKDFKSNELLAGYQLLGLDAKSLHQDTEKGLPPIFVQVTHFKGGEVALHVAFSHQIADGEGMFAFMKAWSESALDGQTSIVPAHDRSLTTSFGEFMAALGDAGGNVAEEEEKVALEDVEKKERANGNDATERRADPGRALLMPQVEPTSNKTLHVKRRVIEDLKREAAEKNMDVTTMDLVTAHIWRSLNNLPVSIDGKTSSVVGFWVDGRKRFHNPPLPERYSGNAIILSYTPRIPAAELAGNSPLFAANLVHNVVRAINPSNWQRYLLEFMAMLKDFNSTEFRVRQCMITSWFRFPMYEISFDHKFGKPILASSNYSGGMLPLGIVMIQPPPPMLSEDAIASLQFIVENTSGAAQALFSDEKFLSFFL